MDRVVDWRLWFEENRGASHEELIKRRMDDARAHAEDPDLKRAFQAVSHLLDYAPAEGLEPAAKLQARADLPLLGRRDLGYQIEHAKAGLPKPAAPPRSVTSKKMKRPSPEKAPEKPASAIGDVRS